MLSFALPKTLPLDGLEIPIDFPYLSAIFQGPPKHIHDDFSRKHPRMELERRAKIFAPFDALDGYSDAVRSKDVEYVDRTDLAGAGLAGAGLAEEGLAEDGLTEEDCSEFSEEDREELSRRLEILHNLTYTGRQARANRVVVTVTYFVPCADENSFAFGIRGLYKTVSGVCWKVDPVGQTITVGASMVMLSSVAGIESADGVFDIEWEIEAP